MQGQARVTPARWWHVPGLTHLIRETRRKRGATSGGALVWAPRWSPSLGLVHSAWTSPVPGVPGPRSFVAEQDGKLVGLAQMRPRREPGQWDVVYFAVEAQKPADRTNGAAPVHTVPDRRAARLLGELCDACVAMGAERLFARIADDSGRQALFKQLGFSTVVREFDYFLPLDAQRPIEAVDAKYIPGLRPQRKADAFGLLQLYQESTPKVVQVGEGKRSPSWELPESGLGTRLTRQSGVQRWVVERETRKVAWLQISLHRRSAHALRLMVDEREPQLPEQLLDFALAAISGQSGSGVVVRVREHQERLQRVLEERGFKVTGSDLLMVKLLAAPVVQHSFAKALEKVV